MCGMAITAFLGHSHFFVSIRLCRARWHWQCTASQVGHVRGGFCVCVCFAHHLEVTSLTYCWLNCQCMHPGRFGTQLAVIRQTTKTLVSLLASISGSLYLAVQSAIAVHHSQLAIWIYS